VVRDKRANRDQTIARIAANQHGVVTTTQLLAAGTAPDTITQWVRKGRLHRIHRGVYAVGHKALSFEGRWKAATLALGEGAVLSHRSAAELWELLRRRPGLVHVTVPGTGGRKRRHGIRIHRVPSLQNTATTSRNGIAVTTPARTIADLRRNGTAGEVRRALRQAEFLKLPLDELPFTDDRTASDPEHQFLGLCGRHRIPAPAVNVSVGPYVVDFLWRDCGLVVEVDGYRAHGGRQAFEADRGRDAYLARVGVEVLRFSARQVTDDPVAIAATIRAVRARRTRA
jgi:Transcriptional regulator, AbiEi antitoxin/Protein of unknown function (DUF559)